MEVAPPRISVVDDDKNGVSACHGDQESACDSASSEIADEIYVLKLQVARLTRRREELRRRSEELTSLRIWQTLAAHELRAKRRAEQLNRKLRDELKSHRAVARKLAHAVSQSECKAMVDESHALRDRSSLLWGRMLDRLDTACDRWRRFFQDPRLVDYHHNLRDWQWIDAWAERSGELDAALNVMAGTVYRFAARNVEDAIWNFLTSMSVTTRGYLQTMDGDIISDDTLDSRLKVTLSTSDLNGAMDARCVRRKLLTDDGAVLVVSSVCGKISVKIEGGSDVDALLCEDSWIRIVSVYDGDETKCSLSALTIAHHVRRLRIQKIGTQQPNRAQAQALHKFVAAALAAQYHQARPQVERDLVQSHKMNRSRSTQTP